MISTELLSFQITVTVTPDHDHQFRIVTDRSLIFSPAPGRSAQQVYYAEQRQRGAHTTYLPLTGSTYSICSLHIAQCEEETTTGEARPR